MRIFSIGMPNLETIGEAFLVENSKLEELKLPKAKKISVLLFSLEFIPIVLNPVPIQLII